MFKLIILFLFYMNLLQHAEATHFRGGYIYWKPTGNEREIELYFRVAYLYPFFSVEQDTTETGEDCTLEDIRDQTPVPTGLEFKCTTYYKNGTKKMSKDSEIFGGNNAFYTCTDIHNERSKESLNWASGYNSSIIKLPEVNNSSRWSIWQKSCCWLKTIINYHAPRNWRMRTLVDLTPRPDLGGFPNSSPKLQGLPIKTVTNTCISYILINAIDDDGDRLWCRWTKSRLGECVENCGNPDPGIFTMQSDECKIKVDPTNAKIGLYGVAVMVEDFPRETIQKNAFSKIPYQFIVEIQAKDCDANITVGSTPCHAVRADGYTLFRMELFARTRNPTVPIRSIDTVKPPEVQVSDLKEDGNGTFYVRVQWRASASMRGKVEQLCYQAIDYEGVAGQEVCVELHMGGVAPKPIPEKSTPSSNTSHVVNSKNRRYTLFFTHPVQFGEDFQSSGVHFLFKNGTVAHNLTLSPENTNKSSEEPYYISFETPEFYLIPGKEYIIRLDEGLVFGTEGCRVPSEPAEWAFKTGSNGMTFRPDELVLATGCSPTSMVVYIEKDIFPGVNSSLLTFEDPYCQATDHNATHLAINTTYGKCGTYAVVNEDKSRVSLINTFYLPRTDQSSSGNVVTRSESYEVRTNCSIPVQRLPYVEFSTKSSTPVIEKNDVGDSDFSLEMFRDETYESHYGVSDYPVNVDKNTRLYLQAQLFPPSPRSSPFLEECVASPTNDSGGNHRYTIIRDGCPVDESVQFHDGPTSTVRFSMEAFSFIGTNLQHSVFVFCRYRYCIPKQNCEVNCTDIGPQSGRAQERGSSYVHVEKPAEWTN